MAGSFRDTQTAGDYAIELTATQNVEPGEYHIEILQVGKNSISHCETQPIITVN